MQSRYQKQIQDLSLALFLLKELLLLIDIYKMYSSDYQLDRVIKTLELWNSHYPNIKDIRVRWWDFGDKRELVKQINLYKQSIVDCISDEQAKQYNLM